MRISLFLLTLLFLLYVERTHILNKFISCHLLDCAGAVPTLPVSVVDWCPAEWLSGSVYCVAAVGCTDLCRWSTGARLNGCPVLSAVSQRGISREVLLPEQRI